MINKESDSVTEAARIIARDLHKGQKDKAGEDYFDGHLTSVAHMGKNRKETITGYLHDAAEDTDYSEKEIVAWLKSLTNGKISDTDAKEIEEALFLLNSKNYKTREEYIENIKKSSLAIHVKLNDLTNNMQLSRIADPQEKDHARIERYKKEYEKVKEYLKKRETRTKNQDKK
ncbi:MAG: phosphohydrolase [Candidatus Azobacteroides sp.]|nr:phosphohydrolase [Candidatus Azobacteroides sp.]